ncbi:MAG: hypothetical protein AAFV95_26965 [Bacteroidota bacterium]
MFITLQTPTPDLTASLEFYQQLQFTVLSAADPCLVTDGQVIIEINPDRYARAGIKMYQKSWDKYLIGLQKLGAVNHQPEGGHLVAAPSGVWVYLEEENDSLFFQRQVNAPSLLGKSAGLSLESTDISKSVQFWEMLDFSHQAGKIENGWITYSRGDQLQISWMKPFSCPHLFFNPSLSYFNGKENLQIIQKIRQLDLPITEEIIHFNPEGKVDNIIIRDPGGFGFFIFND